MFTTNKHHVWGQKLTKCWLKQKVQIENNICIDEGNPSKFEVFNLFLIIFFLKNHPNIFNNIVNYQEISFGFLKGKKDALIETFKLLMYPWIMLAHGEPLSTDECCPWRTFAHQ